MVRVRHCLLALVALAVAGPAAAADKCLSQEQRRAAIASHRAIPLARVVRAVRRHSTGAEVVGARLCYRGSDLVYVLTVLARDGKVIRADVNAASGVTLDAH